MHQFYTDNLGADYARILRAVARDGSEVRPRGLLTRELLSVTVEVGDPRFTLATACGRGIAPGVASMEALQLVGGFSDPAAMLRVSPHFGVFMDGGVFHAPYGPRIASQMPKIVERLQSDPDTRKAVVTIWDPVADLWTDQTRDHPCTTQIQFMIRSGRLDMHVSMRANDAWRGFPYDVFQFGHLQMALACCLDVEYGTYYHHATSFHLYEENIGQVSSLEVGDSRSIDGVGSAGDLDVGDWSAIQRRARELFYGNIDGQSEGEAALSAPLRKAGVVGAW